VKKKRFSVEHIAAILKAGDLGTPVSELCRQHGISEQSYYRWKKLYGNMEPSEARELRQLREENTKLKRLVADLSLDKAMLQDVLQKNSEAGSQETDREVLDGSVHRRCETSVSVRSTASLGLVLQESSRPSDGFAAADTGSGAITCAVRLSTDLAALEARRMGRRQEPSLSTLSRGKPGFTAQATMASCLRGTP
jgi:putative transposase